jgi:hypothetical protein
MSDKPRHWLVAVLVAGSLARLAIGVGGASAADHTGSGYHPRANHLGMVVTAHEIFVSWLKPPGSGTVVVRRGKPTCPRAPDQGTPPVQDSPVHVIDQSVTPGQAYCYTVFLELSDGSSAIVGRTGTVSVPNVSTVPPGGVRALSPVMSASSGGSGTKLAKKVSAGALAALAGLLAVFLLFRGARRVSHRVVMRSTVRESIIGRNSSALVVPTMIALGWIVVVIAFVVLR